MTRHRSIRGLEWPAAQLFYIQDGRQIQGNCVAWWRHGGNGYCIDLKEAWKVPYAEALKIEVRETEIIWPCEQIDALVQQHIDIQKLRPLQKAERQKSPYPNLEDDA